MVGASAGVRWRGGAVARVTTAHGESAGCQAPSCVGSARAVVSWHSIVSMISVVTSWGVQP
jgi:hypothetical protein